VRLRFPMLQDYVAHCMSGPAVWGFNQTICAPIVGIGLQDEAFMPCAFIINYAAYTIQRHVRVGGMYDRQGGSLSAAARLHRLIQLTITYGRPSTVSPSLHCAQICKVVLICAALDKRFTDHS
jgi:hypothetical protein